MFFLSSIETNDNALEASGLPLAYLNKALSRLCPRRDREAMLHGYGAVKFFTYAPAILEGMCANGLAQLLVLHLKEIVVNAQGKDDARSMGLIFQVCFLDFE